MPKINLLQAVNSALDTAMDADSRVVCLGEDIGEFGGVFAPQVNFKKSMASSVVLIPP